MISIYCAADVKGYRVTGQSRDTCQCTVYSVLFLFFYKFYYLQVGEAGRGDGQAGRQAGMGDGKAGLWVDGWMGGWVGRMAKAVERVDVCGKEVEIRVDPVRVCVRGLWKGGVVRLVEEW